MTGALSCPHCGKPVTVVQPMTKRQAEVYSYLVRYAREHKHSPSFDEIAAEFGYGSLATVAEHINNLEAKGYIRRQPMAARGIQCLVAIDDVAEPPLREEP